MIHIEGWIKDKTDRWGSQIEIIQHGEKYSDSLAKLIDAKIFDESRTLYPESLEKVDDEESLIGVEISDNIPDVGLRIYYSETECSLEQAQENVILNAMGYLDIYQVATGYSEYTIMGYDTENFALVNSDGGTHNLNTIFGSLDGKYVHILVNLIH